MEKTEAFALLGKTAVEVAHKVGVTPQAVSAWPDTLPDRIRDRVQAAVWRAEQAGRAKREAAQGLPASA